MLIRSAFTADGQWWTIEESDRVVAPSSGPAQLGVADPAPVQLKDGSWLMIVKSFIEPDGGAQFGQNAGDPPEQSSFEPQPLPRQANPGGPWDHDVIAYRVSANGGAEKMATFERAGVPTAARFKDGRLLAAHQHFPENDRENFDKVAVRFSSDEGRTWGGLQVIQVTGLPEGMRFPFDPTLMPLPDGRVRLYFTGDLGHLRTEHARDSLRHFERGRELRLRARRALWYRGPDRD